MSSFEKAKDKAEQLIGEAEKKVGQMLGLEDPEDAGKRDLLSGGVKEAGHDQATGAVDDTAAVDDTDTAAVDDTTAVDDTDTAAVDDTKDKFSDDDK